MEEINLDEIAKKLMRKYDLKTEVRDNKIYCDESDRYIKNDDTYCEIESLCTDSCDLIQKEYDCYCDYSILYSGYEFVLEIF